MSNKALFIKNLKKTYSNGFIALKEISFDVEKGDFFALLGANGAGKSTTIGIITSLITKSSGNVKVFGHDIDTDISNAKRMVGIVPQEFNFNIFETPLQILTNQAGYYGIKRELALKRAEKYLKELDLWDKRNNKTLMLSGGMKRRLMIARALVHEPKLLILDEPTAGVDIEIRRSMWKFMKNLNKNGTTIILTTHYLEEAESLCKNIAIIKKGEIVENTSMKKLLNKLDIEHFILDLAKPLKELPNLKDFKICKIDSTTLEVESMKREPVNDLFTELSKKGIEVISLRNKTNRLEELFVSITEDKK